MASKPRSDRRMNRPCEPRWRRSTWAHIMGVVVSETTSEIRIATESVSANSRKVRPTMPPISRMGRNTAISDRLIASTVKPTSLAPCRAACTRGMPSSTCRDMFSSTTMASSTTKPVATVSAISDRLSRLKPSRYIAPKVPISDSGTATLGTSAARALRKVGEHHQHHQHDRDHQGAFDIAQRGANGLGAVVGLNDADAGRNRGLQLR